MNKLLKALKNPIHAYKTARSIGMGMFCKLWYDRILGKAKIGSGLRVDNWLSIKGPGKVIIGDNVRIGMTSTPWTFTKEARIFIGSETYLNGTRFACAEKIFIGHNGIFADCRLMDTDFHGTDPENRGEYKVKEILIGDNVWVTVQCIILKGSRIGSDSTITPNSVVSDRFPPRVIAGGNPAKIIKEI